MLRIYCQFMLTCIAYCFLVVFRAAKALNVEEAGSSETSVTICASVPPYIPGELN